MLNDYKKGEHEDEPEQTYITFVNPDHEGNEDKNFDEEVHTRERFQAAMYSMRNLDRTGIVGDFLIAAVESERTGDKRHIEEFFRTLVSDKRDKLECEECGETFVISEYKSEAAAKTALGVHQTRSH